MDRYSELKELRLEIQRKASEINRLTASKRFSSNVRVIEAVRDTDTDTCLIEAQEGSILTTPMGLKTIKVLRGSIQTNTGNISEGQTYTVYNQEDIKFTQNSKLLMDWNIN